MAIGESKLVKWIAVSVVAAVITATGIYALLTRHYSQFLNVAPWIALALAIALIKVVAEQKVTIANVTKLPFKLYGFEYFFAILVGTVAIYSLGVSVLDTVAFLSTANGASWVVPATLVAGLVLFTIRYFFRVLYGITEIAAGLQFASNFNIASTPNVQTFLAILAGGVYLVVRGLDNMEQGREKDRVVLWMKERFTRKARLQKQHEEELKLKQEQELQRKIQEDRVAKRQARLDEIDRIKRLREEEAATAARAKQAREVAYKEAAEKRNRERIELNEVLKSSQRNQHEARRQRERSGYGGNEVKGDVVTKRGPYLTASELKMEAAMRPAIELGPTAQEIARTVMAKNSPNSAAAELAKNGIYPNPAMSVKMEMDRLEASKRDAMAAALGVFKDNSIKEFAKSISGKTIAKESYWKQYVRNPEDHENGK